MSPTNSPIFVLYSLIVYHKFSYIRKIMRKLPYISFRELLRKWRARSVVLKSEKDGE